MNRSAAPVILVCLVAVVCFGGWAVWAHFFENARLNERIAALEDQLVKSKTAEKEALASASASGAASKGGKTPRSEIVSKETSSEASDASEKPGDEGKSMADGLVKMMQNPKMRDAMKAQARMGIDMMYRDLFDLLNLPEPKRSQLEKLVSEKAATGMEIGFSMLGAKKTPEELKKVSEDLKVKNADYDAKIKELIGDEDYTRLKRYEDSTNERMQLKTFSGMLASKNLEMDEATESKLMDAMYSERQKFPFANEFSNQQNTDMARFSQENIERFGNEYGELSQNIVNRASGILTAPQLEVFKESQTQMETMVKMHIEMAGKMFGDTSASSEK